MGLENASPRTDQRLSALAGRQHGVVTRAQLRALGVGDHGVYARVRTGRLHRAYRGVYAVGHRRLTREGRLIAAVLACGHGAVLSHASAAALWEIRASAATVIDVTVPSQNGRTRVPGIRIHRSRRLGPGDVTRKDGIAITTVARTLLDLADVLSRRALKRAIDETEYLRLFDLTAIVAVVRSNPGRRGKRLLELCGAPPQLTRSELEQRFLALVERAGLPQPRVAARVLGYEVDFFWPEAELVVETDGWAAHGTRAAFERDRARDRRLLRSGICSIRVTASDVARGDALVAELRDLVRS
jgi:very-short-patch-repair endonuclease